MEQKITLTLARADAETLLSSLRRRKERLCDIKQELCEPDEFEQEVAAYFEREDKVVERIITVLDSTLSTLPAA
jgi:hypothetical protein